ncbi:MAG TPA: hypothetical protein VGR63_02555 [Casimicrobiaceae bacterium]|jgi:hypothetical protein|nr:hypothetical protein [Casimicrobiaceae bacterium]
MNEQAAMKERNGNSRPEAAEEAARAEVVALDEPLIALLADFRQQAQAIEAQARGALALFMRQHALAGNWQIAANGRELVRAGGE